ncbi:hypothetical protein, partial [Niastella vici]|uniref:hypothetical protein n=1 Tax=Niastella vici TaxID=1703345 RepID=UPI001C1FB3F1
MKRSLLVICMSFLAGMEIKAQTNSFPASGNVGIGTTSPAYPLHIVNTSSGSPATISLKSAYSGTSDVYLGGLGDYGAVLSYNMDPANGTVTNNAISPNQFKAVAISVGGYNNPFMFSVTNFPSGSITPRMVVDWNGNVGIGTTSPAATLHVLPALVGDGGVKFSNA